MKQVVQDQSGGQVSVLDVPEPLLQPHGILVDTVASVISSGTERNKIEMGEKSLLAKARARPDLARKVVQQAQKDGLQATLDLVRDRLGMPQPLGYSAVGRVREVGAVATGYQAGQLVAIAGAGHANHAEVNCVPGNLAAIVPDGVAPEQAAFATLGAIALHGIRQAKLSQGELVVVSGLGLIGQLTVRLLKAYGHPVVGVDPSPVAQQEVEALGVEVRSPDDAALARLGADAVLLTAATKSDGPVQAAPTWCRDRGRVVVVGDVGLGLTRPPYYDKEVDLRFSRSYGPGRYDPGYEEQGRDYPIGYVRWTEGRNLQEFLRLLDAGLLQVGDLVDATFPVEDAEAAYHRLAHGERARALVLTYAAHKPRPPARSSLLDAAAGLPARSRLGRVSVSVCGAGNFARKTLLPALQATGAVDWAYVSTASGLTARHVADERGFRGPVATPEEAIAGAGVDAVLVATRHDSHGRLAALCASRGLPAYVEKPLTVDRQELSNLEESDGRDLLTTGFNRRAAPATQALLQPLRGRREPAVLHVRVNAGRLPAGHWADAAEQGGRIVGEVCHFVDLACFLLGSPVRQLAAVGSGAREPQVEDTLQILLRHTDASTTTITYTANGSSDLSKELVEAHWDGRSAVIDDFRTWRLDSGDGMKKSGSRKQDKGHARLVSDFVQFALGAADNPVPFRQAAHVMRVCFATIEALTTGEWQDLQDTAW